MIVYKSKTVSELQDFYGALLFPQNKSTLLQYLEPMANRLWEGIQSNSSVVGVEISNYDPVLKGKRLEIPLRELTEEVAFRTIACEYGFTNWQEVMHLGEEPLDLVFEKTVNFILAGNMEALQREIISFPKLLTQRSQFGHQATLLHYTASNGVELWRQAVPLNLPEITKFLVEKGVDKYAKMRVYGGQFDTLSLLTSSAHPYEAGIGKELERVLS
jgi:hypothetical protein